MSLKIKLCFNSGRPQSIEVSENATVDNLKQNIADIHKVSSDDINIIFQGQYMPDKAMLKSCQLSENSCLHAVHVKRPRKLAACRPPLTPNGLNDILDITHVAPAFQPTTEGDGRVRFYVYCKDVCKAVQPGKLRVICATCKQSTLTVDRAPADWQDVLTPNTISGECQAKDCPGIMAEFIFKCAAHLGETDVCSVLNLVKTNTLRVPCVTCTMVDSPVFVFPCAAGHTMCLDCFQAYCIIKLNNRSFIYREEIGYTVECPAGCDFSWIRTPHHFRILGNEQYARFQRIAAEDCLLQMGGVICPSPHCGAGLLPVQGERTVICERLDGSYGCGLEFCVECFGAPHDEDCRTSLLAIATTSRTDDYQMDAEKAERAEWEKQSRLTVQETTKPCPKCKVPVEKAGGCMHMACACCGCEWCWMCAVMWNRDCQGDHWFD